MANYVNRITIGPESTGKNQNAAGRPDTVTGTELRQGQTAPVASAADELMNQLVDDRNETNMRSNSAMIRQALKEAGLPANSVNTAVVNALLRGGMPISRESIRSTLADVRAYSQLDADAVVAMRRAGIPVTSESAATVREFFDNSAIIADDISSLADMTETLLTSDNTTPEIANAVKLAIYDAVRSAAMSSGENGAAAASLASGNVTTEIASAAQTALAGLAAAAPSIEAEQLPYRIVIESTPTALPDEPATEGGGETTGSAVSGNGTMSEGALSGTIAGETSDSGTSAGIMQAEGNEIAASEILQGEMSSEILSDAGIVEDASGIMNAEDSTGRFDYSFRNFEELVSILSADNDGTMPKVDTPDKLPKTFSELTPAQLKHLLKTSLSLSARNLSKDGVREIYERTAEFTSKIKAATEQSPEHAALNAKAAQTADDLTLLNNLNRIYPHVELPLRFENSEAKGGLYVYTNRRSKSAPTDPVTALLHLDMPSLGPIDIHLSLKDKYLGMNFYTDSEAGRLLSGDITYLRERLEKMDYSMFARFNPKEALEHGIKNAVASDKASEEDKTQPERLSFDIRA